MSSVNALPPLGAKLAFGKRVFAFAKQRLRSVDAFSTLRATFVLCLGVFAFEKLTGFRSHIAFSLGKSILAFSVIFVR